MARGKAWNRGQGLREPNGRLSRDGDEKNKRRKNVRDFETAIILETAIWQREKLLKEEEFKKRIPQDLLEGGKIPMSILRDEKIGTTHGRLFYIGQGAGGISRDQWDAASWFLELRNKYHCAINSPEAITDLPEGYTPSDDPDAHVRYCDAIRSRWADVERAIVDAVFECGDKNIVGALDLIIVQQKMDYDLVGDLRIALNAIHKVRIGEKKRSARG